MTFSTRNFDPLTPLAPKFPNFATQILLFRFKHTVAVVTHADVLPNSYTTWVRGVACQKQCLGPKLERAGLRRASKIWDPLRISATVAASNFKFGTQLGFGTSLPKNDVKYQNWRGSGPREHPKNWDPLLISATVEASNFKFGRPTQIGFGTSLPKMTFRTKNWRGSGLGEHPKKFGTPYLFLQPLKLATSNLVHKLGLGLAYQNNV